MPFRQESQAFFPDIYKPHASGKTPSTLACIPRPPCPISCPPCSDRVHGVGPPGLMEIQQLARELDISVRVGLALPADDSEKPRAPNLAVDDGQAGARIDRVGSNHALPPIRGNPVDLRLRVLVNVPCLNLIDDNIIAISLSAILRRAVPRPAATEKSARGPSRSDVRLYGVATVRPPWAQGAFRVEQVQVLVVVDVVDGPVDGDVHE